MIETDRTSAFREARDILLASRSDLDSARRRFVWPRLSHFNWATDWFDVVAKARPQEVALWVVSPGRDIAVTFAELSLRSRRTAAWLRRQGVRAGDRILTCLSNGPEIYEVMLAAMRLEAVIIPTYTKIGKADFEKRIQRGRVSCVIAEYGMAVRMEEADHASRRRIVVGGGLDGWIDYGASASETELYDPPAPTPAQTPCFGYFTSGTTSEPKIVLHSHVSYAVGHLSSMYWNGVMPGDVHLNVSTPGWAKHSWSSLFVPWNAEATLVVFSADDVTPNDALTAMRRLGVTSFCAPPTFWRRMLRDGLGRRPDRLRETTSAGEPLDASLADSVRAAWGGWIRDGYGQSETTGQIGNCPGQEVTPGSMGRALPGYDIVLIDPQTGIRGGDHGEICVLLRDGGPAGVMLGYDGDPVRTGKVLGGDVYRTGDLARIDGNGHLWFVGRIDDLFKSFDFRISPFELEHVLKAHPQVEEAVIVPRPHPVGLFVAKAFVQPVGDIPPTASMARALYDWMADRLAPQTLPRCIEFVADFPKTRSGKLLRRDLRAREETRTGIVGSSLEFEF